MSLKSEAEIVKNRSDSRYRIRHGPLKVVSPFFGGEIWPVNGGGLFSSSYWSSSKKETPLCGRIPLVSRKIVSYSRGKWRTTCCLPLSTSSEMKFLSSLLNCGWFSCFFFFSSSSFTSSSITWRSMANIIGHCMGIKFRRSNSPFFRISPYFFHDSEKRSILSW